MRRTSREVALMVLFQLEFAPHIEIQRILEVYQSSPEFQEDQPALSSAVISYAELLIAGVLSNKTELDSKIQSVSRHWKIERMGSVDRNILRVASFELLFSQEPMTPNIVINESVEIAKKFGSADSAAFINGILDQMKTEFLKVRG